MVRPLIVAATAALVLALAGPAQAAQREPWEAAADLRTTLAEAQRALVLGEPGQAKQLVRKAATLDLGPLAPAAQPGLAAAGGGRGGGGPCRAGDRPCQDVDGDSGRGRRARHRRRSRRRRRFRSCLAPRPGVSSANAIHAARCRRHARSAGSGGGSAGRRRGCRRDPGRPARHVPGPPSCLARDRGVGWRTGLRHQPLGRGGVRTRVLRGARSRLRRAAVCGRGHGRDAGLRRARGVGP